MKKSSTNCLPILRENSDEYNTNAYDNAIRPSLSLELSLSPSNEAHGLAAALSQDDDDEIEETHCKKSMEAACHLVQSLLDQVTWNDAPPMNEGGTEHTYRVKKVTGPPTVYSRQCHVHPRSPNSALSPDYFLGGGASPKDLWETHYRNRSNPAEVKMGNVALATLCSRTLETVGKSSLPTKEVDGNHLTQYINRNNHNESVENNNSSNSPHKKHSPWGRRKNHSTTKTSTSWLRKKNKKNKPISSSSTTNPFDSRDDVPTSRYKEHETESSNASSIGRRNNDENIEPLRLQMFGSEYARFLSTTALAPSEHSIPASKVGMTNPIQHRSLNQRHRRSNLRKIENLEDATQSVLTGAITDIVITHGEEIPPKGYYRISQSASGNTFFLRDKKQPAYINVKKETNWDRAAQRPCVTSISIIFPEKKEFVPPGFSVVRRYNPVPTTKASGGGGAGTAADRAPANLNLGGEPIFLCFRRSREGNPVTGLIPLFPAQRETIPEGYTVVERTPRNYVASIQTTSSHVFLAYRQRLANLEPLRPLPLVMSVHKGPSSARKLTAYYCTGGTVVESRVGRFHIMDRSTHSLLSPSSISNRLSLIEASRRKTMNSLENNPCGFGISYSYSAGKPQLPRTSSEVFTSSVLLAPGLGSPLQSPSVISDLERMSSQGEYEPSDAGSSSERTRSIHIAESNDLMNTSTTSSHASFGTETTDDSFDLGASGSGGIGGHQQQVPPTPAALNQSYYANNDNELKRCLGVMNFIPVVSTGVIGGHDPMDMLRFQARVAIITPILTACYTRHGGSSHLAVEGLFELLEQKFFASDVNMAQDTSSSTKLTLLDIVVQVVCDVATMGTQEMHLHSCVEFVEAAIKFGCGHLNTRTIGYVLRFYLFVFYFGVSTPSATAFGSWGLGKGFDQRLLNDPRESGEKYLPGGAPQCAMLALKDLISFSVARLGSLSKTDRVAMQHKENQTPKQNLLVPDMFNNLINNMVGEVVDKSVHRVDIANYTQLAMHQIYRSGGSELFWYDMINSCGVGLFGQDLVLREETRNTYSLCFALLANCVKVASAKIRRDKHSEGIPRDIASKLMSLEMLQFFLQMWEANQEDMNVPGSTSHDTFVFCIRRLVVPCLLSNTGDALDDPRIYRRTIRIVGTILTSPLYRHHMKLELGILLEHFVLKILRLRPQILHKKTSKNESGATTFLFAQQIELMKEIKNWFSGDRSCLMELYLNFDMENRTHHQDGGGKELLSGIQWNICQQICACLCSISEQCGEFIADQIRESQSMSKMTSPRAAIQDEEELMDGVSGVALARESAQRLRKGAVEAISRIVFALLEAGVSSKGKAFRELFRSWVVDPQDLERFRAESKDEDDSTLPSEEDFVDGKERGVKTPVKSNNDESNSDEEETKNINHLNVAFDIAREKGLRKAIDYLIACNILTPSPRDVASFLRIHRNELQPRDLGSYLGEGGTDGSETEYWNLIRFSFIRAISFVGMTVEQGLRHLLTNGGFHLPGEAQQIDRIMTTFSQCFWEDNAGDPSNCPFQDQDTVFLLSFAIIMLNTDLHKQAPIDSKKKHIHKRMTKSEFLSNLRGVSKGEELHQDHLSTIYDSIEARPILLSDDAESTLDDLQSLLDSMSDHAKSMEALLRGLSTHEYKFVTLNDHSHDLNGSIYFANGDVARNFMSKTWHHFHGLINAALEIAHLDFKGMESCVNVLEYALGLTICLDMPMERTAFLLQLGRFRLFNAWRQGEATTISNNHESFKNEEWYIAINAACSETSRIGQGRLESLQMVHEIIQDLGLNIAVDVEGKRVMRDVVRRLQNSEFLLNDPTRRFLRQGDLLKRANRSGRLSEYRFFLFSDMLIYAKKVSGGSSNNNNSSGEHYKIHEELPLILMKVVDWFPRDMKREARKGFEVFHPRKKFMVYCRSSEERKSWVSSIRAAIEKELERKVAIEAARMAAGKPSH